jgi:hypothetical protein
MGITFGKTGSKQDSKSINRFEFPTQLLEGLERTIGRPFSIDELRSIIPFGRIGSRLSGGGAGVSGQPLAAGPSGGGGQGFGFSSANLAQTPQADQAQQRTGAGQEPTPSSMPVQPDENTRYTASDLMSYALRAAPNKVADIGRLMKKGKLNPEGFTLAELDQAWKKFGKSSGNTKALMAGLRGSLAETTNLENVYNTNRYLGGF